jgi:hypothetical protein
MLALEGLIEELAREGAVFMTLEDAAQEAKTRFLAERRTQVS